MLAVLAKRTCRHLFLARIITQIGTGLATVGLLAPDIGRVRSATGVVDPETRAATVIVTPTAGGSTAIPGQLVPGQFVQAHVFASGGAARDGLMVPQDAVQTIGSRTVVFVRTRDGFKARTVQVGRRSGGLVAIVSGLTTGTPVATANAFLLKAELGKESAE